MSATTAILYKPTSTIFTSLSSSKRKFPNTLSSPKFPSSKKLGFSRESVPNKPFSWNLNTMTVPTRIAAFRATAAGDEGVRGLEQEAFVHGSSDFSPNLMPDGLETTLNKLSKWLVTALFGLVLLWRHDAAALWAAMGSVLNAGLSTVLKHILNQERPHSTLRSDPGMPSSHAQTIIFSVMFVVLSMVEWLGVNAFTITLSGLALAFGSYLSWLRVSQQFHTISQVVVGASLGFVFSILWFWSWDAIVLKAFISHLWVRAIVVLGAAGFCLGFLLYIIRYWVMDEELSL